MSGGALTGSAAALSGTMTALSGVGMAMSAYGSYQQSRAQQAQLNYQAEMADLQAKDAISRGEDESIELGRRARQLRGEQEATMAARGLDISSGSPLDILRQTDYFGIVDQTQARNNARREAAGFQQQAAGSRAAASSINPLFEAGGSLLSGFGQVASQWYAGQAAARGTDGAYGNTPQGLRTPQFQNNYSQAWRATREH